MENAQYNREREENFLPVKFQNTKQEADSDYIILTWESKNL